MMSTQYLRWALMLAGVALVGCRPAGEPVDFEPMRKLVIDGRHDEAITRLKAYIAQRPQGKHASRAGLFLFKANFAKREYAEARRWCDWTLKNHPDSLEALKCEFKIGLILIAQADLDGALEQFNLVSASNRNPLSPEAQFFVDELKARLAARDREQPHEDEQP